MTPPFVYVVQGAHFGDELYVFDTSDAADAFLEARGGEEGGAFVTEEPVLDATWVAQAIAADRET